MSKLEKSPKKKSELKIIPTDTSPDKDDKLALSELKTLIKRRETAWKKLLKKTPTTNYTNEHE